MTQNNETKEPFERIFKKHSGIGCKEIIPNNQHIMAICIELSFNRERFIELSRDDLKLYFHEQRNNNIYGIRKNGVFFQKYLTDYILNLAEYFDNKIFFPKKTKKNNLPLIVMIKDIAFVLAPYEPIGQLKEVKP